MTLSQLSQSADELLLVVDDDHVTRMTICKVLQRAGYEVVEASNGTDALAIVNQRRPSMVLMDVVMPEMDGYETCQRLRQHYDHQSLPVLMLTGLNDVDSIDQAFDSGATDFITKPLNWTLLTQRIRYALRTRSMGYALQRNQQRLSQAQRIARLGYWEMELESRLVHCSDELFWLLGLSPEAEPVSLDNFLQMVHSDDRQQVMQVIDKALQSGESYELEHRLLLNSGHSIVVHQQGMLEQDDQGLAVALLGTIQDISERKAAEELIEYQAFYDSLTDLPNRRLFTDHLAHAIHLASQQGGAVAVVFMGLDRFKVVNDSMGHAAGDTLLREFASRLKQFPSEGIKLARFGADVFAMLVEGAGEKVEGLMSQLQQQVAEPLTVQGQELFLSASAGIAIYPHDGQSAEALLKAADTAMSRAKEGGGQQVQYFTSDMNAMSRKRLRVESDLRKALEHGDEFALFYQPQVDAVTGEIVSMEALIRWFHPQQGMVPPLEFISVAEETGLIVPIGEWVLHSACRQTQQWNSNYGLQLRVGVNLSGRQFAEPNLIEVVSRALQQSGLPHGLLDLEVTESIAMNDIDGCIASLQQFKEMGIYSSMDDFGTGYSSLSYLQQMPLHTLKIDRAFVKDIKGDGENGEMARTIIAMAHSLGLNVIAEGVETEEQLQFLRGQGCDIIQGFYISKPLDVEGFEELLQAMQPRYTSNNSSG